MIELLEFLDLLPEKLVLLALQLVLPLQLLDDLLLLVNAAAESILLVLHLLGVAIEEGELPLELTQALLQEELHLHALPHLRLIPGDDLLVLAILPLQGSHLHSVVLDL